MRLSKNETDAIKDALVSIARGLPFKLYLFGSRTDDTKRGGDIDLLCIVDNKDLAFFQLEKTSILYEIKSRIGEQKIDFIISTEDHITSDSFLNNIFKSAIAL